MASLGPRALDSRFCSSDRQQPPASNKGRRNQWHGCMYSSVLRPLFDAGGAAASSTAAVAVTTAA
mgnify:CR=1 FL=1